MTELLPIVPDPSAPALPPGLVLPRLHEHFTRSGTLLTRSLVLPMDKTAAWQSIWGKHKKEFTRRGFSLKCDNGKWMLVQWLVPDSGTFRLTQFGAQKLHAVEQGVQRKLPLAEAAAPVLELEPLPGDLEEKLFEYQIPAARQLFRAVTRGEEEWGYPGAWDCSDLGTGKTYSSLAAALATGRRVVVVCPKSVIGTKPSHGGRGSGWLGAFAHFGAEPLAVRNYESLRTGNQDHLISLTGEPKRPFKWEVDPETTIVIWDEAHKLKSVSLNRSMCFAAARQGIPMICVSGTMADSPTRMGATGICIGLHRGDPQSYAFFLAQHGCEKKGESWTFQKGRDGAVHLTKLHRRIFPMRGARIRIADLGDRFPQNQILCEAYQTPDTEAIRAAFARAQGTVRNLERQGKSPSVIKMLERMAYMEAWKQSERIKVPVVAEMARTEIEAGRSVAIFLNFNETREMMARELKTDCMIFGGQTGDKGIRDRNRHIADFQSDKSRVIIANIAAGGVGISLHDLNGNHPRTSIILPNNDATAMTQALGRIYRSGAKTPCRQIIFYAAETIEAQICESVRAKMAAMTSLNDGDFDPPDIF